MKNREFLRKSECSVHLLFVLGTVAILALSVAHGVAQGTAFTYQGRLNDSGLPATGIYDLRFTIYDSPGAGNAVASQLTSSGVGVTNGLFTVSLDFGTAVFTGPARWLQIAARTNGATTFTNLSPRQALTASPYAIHADTASNVPDGTVVKSLNNLRDNVTLATGGNVTLTTNGSTLTIYSTGGGDGGPWLLNGFDTYYNAGNVGIGTDFPASGLTVRTPYYGIEHTDGDVRLVTSVGTLEPIGAGLGTASNHKLKFFVNNGLPSMLIDTNGNVGIGTAQPQGLLDLHTGTSDTSALFVRGDPSSFGRGGIIHHQSSIYGWQELAQTTGSDTDGYLTFHYVNRTAPGTKLASDVLTLRANGNVGIGTPTPASPLTVLSPAYGIEQTDGNIRLGTFVGAGAGWLGTINDFPLSFFVNGGGASLTVDTSGNTRVNGRLGIGSALFPSTTVTLSAKAGDLSPLEVFDSSGNGVLSLNTFPNHLRLYGDASKSSGGTSWGIISDRRVKQDVRDYQNGLDKVLKLRPVRFHYRDDPERGLSSKDEEVGFIAQEVREVMPDAVTEGKDGYLSLKADPIHWAAINAIRELNAKLEEQRAENAGLKRRLERLEQLMNDQSVVKGGAR